MPYAPTVNDNSGQILAQGINQGVNSLAEGIQRSIAERKKNEEDRKAKEAVNAAGKGLFGEDFDVKDANPKDYGTLIQMYQAKRDEPMRKLAIENEGLKQKISQSQIDQYAVAAAQQARNQAAMRGAFNPTTATAQAIQGGAVFENLPGPTAMDAESAMRYMLTQGADMPTIQAYSQTVDNMAQAKQRSQVKPLPGSQGISSQMVPGFGNIARDNATGELISSGNFINDSTKPLEADVAFQSNVEVATESLKQLENIVKNYGTWESGWVGNSEAAAGLEALPYKIAIQTAKIVDPGSVAREGEVAAAQKYIIPLGMFANKETALAAINQHRKTIKDYGSAREKASGAIKKPGMTPGAAPAANSGGAPAAPANAQAATHFTDTDGTKYPIVTAGSRRGVIKDGKFYPIIP